MTREEKIVAFGKKKEAEDNENMKTKLNKESELKEQVCAHKNRVDELIHLASMCRDNKVSLGEKQDFMWSKGVETNCYISNGWSHRMGFNRDLTAVGFYNGGANGEIDMWFYEDGRLEYPTSDYHMFCDGLEKWLSRFDEFETAFNNYIDDLI